MTFICRYDSQLGGITMASDGVALTGLWFDGQKYFGGKILEKDVSYEEKDLPVFRETVRWLDLYFDGKQPDFLPEMRLEGTEFRREVWEILLKIPYGKTMTYGEIGAEIARKRGIAKMSAQAVGGAVGHNPISILIPCHRVLGADGSLTGYAGGVKRKFCLLALEQNIYT